MFVGDVVPDVPMKRLEGSDVALIIGNLECAFGVSNKGNVASEKAYASILPRGLIKNVATGGFDALSLANNHVNDAGDCDEMCEELKLCFPWIQFFGTVDKPYAEVCNDNGRAVIIGCLEPCRSRGKRIFKQENVAALISKLRKENAGKQELYIYVYPHWGRVGEYTRYPAPSQRRLARQWIDAGADGIIGNHAHVPQGKECYKGRAIYYSLGNYFFRDGEDGDVPESSDRMIVRFDGRVSSEVFDTPSAADGFLRACQILNDGWTKWRWARTVGPLYCEKSMRSWKMRLRKHFWITLPKIIIWSLMPQNLFLILASLCSTDGRTK
jgi:poly-gamma-glutamate synthesis protein (capsule biosynthesis protein)